MHQIFSSTGILFRRHNDESDSNLIQLLKYHAKEDGVLLEWLQRKTNKYTSPEIQISLINISIKRKIAEKLQKSPFLTIMIDEIKRKLIIVIRRVDEDLDVFEEFIGLDTVPAIDATTLLSVINDTLIRMNLSL